MANLILNHLIMLTSVQELKKEKFKRDMHKRTGAQMVELTQSSEALMDLAFTKQPSLPDTECTEPQRYSVLIRVQTPTVLRGWHVARYAYHATQFAYHATQFWKDG